MPYQGHATGSDTDFPTNIPYAEYDGEGLQEGIKVYVDEPLANVDEGDRIGRVYVKGNNIDGWLDLFVENVSSTIIASTQDEKVRINGLNALEYCSVYTSLEDENLRIYAIYLEYDVSE